MPTPHLLQLRMRETTWKCTLTIPTKRTLEMKSDSQIWRRMGMLNTSECSQSSHLPLTLISAPLESTCLKTWAALPSKSEWLWLQLEPSSIETTNLQGTTLRSISQWLMGFEPLDALLRVIDIRATLFEMSQTMHITSVQSTLLRIIKRMRLQPLKQRFGI